MRLVIDKASSRFLSGKGEPSQMCVTVSMRSSSPPPPPPPGLAGGAAAGHFRWQGELSWERFAATREKDKERGREGRSETEGG